MPMEGDVVISVVKYRLIDIRKPVKNILQTKFLMHSQLLLRIIIVIYNFVNFYCNYDVFETMHPLLR